MGGVNFMMHGAGWMEGGLHASFVKMILDADLLQMVTADDGAGRRRRATLAIDTIERSGPAGTSSASPTPRTASGTRSTARCSPTGATTRPGRRPAGRRRRGGPTLVTRFLDEYEPPVMDPAVREELEAFVARRVAEGGVHRLITDGDAIHEGITQVVVIGGGVVGASVLYHLTKAGWTDVVLLERKQLTAGIHVARGRWHAHAERRPERVAAAAVHDQAVQGDRGRVGTELLHPPARRAAAGRTPRASRLAAHGAGARAATSAWTWRSSPPTEAKELNPLLEEKYFVGALYDAVEGSVDPYGVTHAYAICARSAAPRSTPTRGSTDLRQRADGTWDVITDKGTPSTPSTSSTPAGCGRVRSGAWSVSSCRCWPWSTTT